MSKKNNPVENAIISNIENQDCIFVFPTQVSASEWADRATEISGRKAVATERFIAWDQFKGSSIRSSQQEKESVPSIMRAFFSENLIKENSENPFLSYIIPKEYAGNAQAFASQIASLLPSLNLWKNRFEKNNLTPDDEDKDLLEIHKRYKDFLDKNNLFDPAWETPPFYADGKKYIIFYPEILMDYLEYKEILESSKDISLVHLENEKTELEVHIFKSAREELHYIANYIRSIHEKENIPWTSICISVPDLDTYSPYVQRELSLYQIPHVAKNGKPLSSYGAGAFFSQVQNCAAKNFYFESVKTLLLNNELPWKDQEAINELIKFGKRNNCLFDIWEEAFENPKKEYASKKTMDFYRSLHKRITALAAAKTFSDIRKQYFSFREKFFDMENCPLESDLIISRCISELSQLIDMEEKYPGLTLPNPFAFFTDYLSDKLYLSQNAESGVQVLPYRLASSAPFKVHILMDSNQESLTTVYRQLGFLREEKRQKLGLTEDANISGLFIKLYKLSAQTECLFTCSEKTFSGYAIPHCEFTEQTEEKVNADDLYAKEKAYFLGKSNEVPSLTTESAAASFENYLSTQEDSDEESDSREKIAELINEKYFKEGKFHVSTSAMKDFNNCPRCWIFNRVLKTQEEDNEATLMDKFAVGNLNHKILELFCSTLKEKNLPLALENQTLSEEYAFYLKEAVSKAIMELDISQLAKELDLNAKDAYFEKMLDVITDFSKRFAGCKIAETEKSYTLPSPDGKYMFTGTIDCLLKNEEEAEYILVDFKTSDKGVPKTSFYASEENPLPDPQIPMYLYLLSHEEGGKKNVENAAFYNLNDKMFYGVTGALVKKADVDFEPTMQAFLQNADNFVNKILNKDFSVPEDLSYNTCLACDYRAVCRRTFTVGNKKD